jgi:hypothetical protein
MAESQLRFLSGNEFKIGQAKKILEPCGIEVVPIEFKIEELQTTSPRTIRFSQEYLHAA